MIVPSPGRYLAVAHSSTKSDYLYIVNHTRVFSSSRLFADCLPPTRGYSLACLPPATKSRRATEPSLFSRRTADEPWVRSAKVPGASARGGTRATRCAGGTSPNAPGRRRRRQPARREMKVSLGFSTRWTDATAPASLSTSQVWSSLLPHPEVHVRRVRLPLGPQEELYVSRSQRHPPDQQNRGCNAFSLRRDREIPATDSPPPPPRSQTTGPRRPSAVAPRALVA